jgi:hypothetical protein
MGPQKAQGSGKTQNRASWKAGAVLKVKATINMEK